MTGLEFLSTILVAVMVALPPTLLAWRTTRKVEKVQTTANEIHVLTNSNLAAVKASLEAANERIISLEKLVTELAKRGVQ